MGDGGGVERRGARGGPIGSGSDDASGGVGCVFTDHTGAGGAVGRGRAQRLRRCVVAAHGTSSCRRSQ